MQYRRKNAASFENLKLADKVYLIRQLILGNLACPANNRSTYTWGVFEVMQFEYPNQSRF